MTARSEPLASARGAVERRTLEDGSTVIAKRRDPEWATVNLGTERVALEELARVGADVAPRVLAGSEELGELVLSDVGTTTVESLLFGNDPAAARDGLAALGAAAARLHDAPVDPDAFAGLGTWTYGGNQSGWPALRDAIAEHRLPAVGAAVDDEAAAIQAALRDPPPAARLLVHGDLTPSNAVLDDAGRCRLVDFEGAGPQHVGVDLAMIRYPFLWYGRWRAIPREEQRAFESAYRANRDVDVDDDAITIGCAAMALLRLERLPRVAADDQAPDVAFRRRLQLAWTLDIAAESSRTFPALSAWFADVADAMRARWEEARRPLPVYPAYL